MLFKMAPPAFLHLNPLVPTPRRCRHSLTCSQQLPEGAKRAPRSLEDRLGALQFSYESPNTLPGLPGCVRYMCAHGHIVTGTIGSPACRRCPTCSFRHPGACGRPLCISTLRALAVLRGGLLLSDTYVNSREKLEWQCKHGHRWKASADNVRGRGSWCPECAKEGRRKGIGEMRRVAARLGGECLSEVYVSGNVKLKWRCSEGHVFEMAPNNVLRKPGGKRKASWCPTCRKASATRGKKAMTNSKTKGKTGEAKSELVRAVKG